MNTLSRETNSPQIDLDLDLNLHLNSMSNETLPHPGTNTDLDTSIDSNQLLCASEFAFILKQFRLLLPKQEGFDLFSLISSFKSIALKNSIANDNDGSYLENWLLEAKFWNLVEILIRFRYSVEDSKIGNASAINYPTINSFTSNLFTKESILAQNPRLRELYLVQQWLIDNFNLDDGEDEDEDDQDYDDSGDQKGLMGDSSDKMSTIKWLNTKIDIESNKPNVVKYLDSDSIIRSSKSKLNSQDVISDDLFYKKSFDLLIRSKFDELDNLCSSTNNWNFSLIVKGLLDHFDSSIDKIGEPHAEDEQKSSSVGIKHSILFKKSVYRLLQNPKIHSIYEKGCYGFICGDFNSLQSLTSSYEKKLLFYVKNLYEFEITKYMIEVTNKNELNNYSLPAKVTNNLTEILNNLSQDSNQKISNQSKHPIRVLIGSVLSNNISQLLSLDENIPIPLNQFHLLKILIHFIIFIKLLDEEIISDKNFIKYLKVYINNLIIIKKFNDVPIYLSFIQDNSEVVDLYSFIIKNYLLRECIETQSNLRIEQIKLIRELNLPLEDILIETFKKLYQENTTSIGNDTLIIELIKWFVDSKVLTNNNQFVQMIKQFIEYCLNNKKLELLLVDFNEQIDLTQIINEISLNRSVLMTMNVADMDNDDDDDINLEISVLREYKILIDTMNHLSDLDVSINSTTLKSQFDDIISFIQNWSVGNENYRKIYIPIIVNTLVDKLLDSGKSENCDQLIKDLINILSSSNHNIYQLFDNNLLQNFMKKISVIYL